VKRAAIVVVAGVACVLALWACNDDDPGSDPADTSPRVRKPGEPRRVFLDRILISYRGNPFRIASNRSLEEAQSLARRVYEQARSGAKFDELRNAHSDDRLGPKHLASGPYILLNYDIDISPTMPETPRMKRGDMGRRLGDIAFEMRPGDIALVEYHAKDYSAGYEVIRCLQRDDRTEEQVKKDLQRPREPNKK
jgi:hypothetical protein